MELGVTLVASDLNPDIGDLMVNEAGSEVLLTNMADEVVQRLRVSFEFFRGEWFLDLTEGTPYFEWILKKGPSDLAIRTVFGSVIRNTPGVDTLMSFSYSISRTRQLSVSFSVRCVDGSVVKIVDFPPFRVDDGVLQQNS